MRIAAAALVLAACGTEQGAYLVLTAPDGPRNAASYELVLASPDEIPVIAPQRVTPTGTATETVTYYLQATQVSATGSLDLVDHFTILVEPTGADGTFIPFVLLRDGAGALVGMGTFRATDQGAPAPILVRRSELDRYELAVEPVDEVTDAMAVDTRQAMTVSCTQDQATFDSGIVWRPRTGPELRVLLAEPGANGDATTRKLDMDCDAHDVAPNDTAADCDDTRARFHAGATEACDMEDTNCDNIRAIAVPCQLPNGGTCNQGMGVALCDDTTGTISSTCAPDPACACAGGTTGCVLCVLSHETDMPPPNETVPCQPGVGQIGLSQYCSGGAPCTVQVLGTRGGWDAAVSENQTSFGPIATNVGSNVLLRVQRPEGPGTAIPGAPGHPVGTVDLDVIDTQGLHHYVGVELQMDTTDAVCPASSVYSMPCSG